MLPIKKVAIFGASGNFGAPITSALLQAGFEVTVVTRAESAAVFPEGVARVVRTLPGSGYNTAGDDNKDNEAVIREALRGQDAAVSVLGPAAVGAQAGLAAAAEAAGVRRFVVDDFGWGPGFRNMPELNELGARRRVGFDAAAGLARENPAFTWTGVAIGNPIDWALKKFPAMGFDINTKTATIYDSGTEEFTGTTLEGIGRAVAGVLLRPAETANRYVRVRSVQTRQRELLAAFQSAAAAAEAAAGGGGGGGGGQGEWAVKKDGVAALLERGRAKIRAGQQGWGLDMVVAQLYEEGEARCVVASREESDNELLGVRDESVHEIVAKALSS